jgi:NADPH:quinone reductase-like Zn-dependent oxidoreductase
MATMNAVRISNFGGFETMSYQVAPRPEAGEGQVLIRIQATSVNPVDNAIRAGYMAGFFTPNFPYTLGMDVAGTVAAVGQGVNNFAPGDAVFGRTELGHDGSYAEYVVLPADDIVAIPRSLNFIQAAALPHVALTAWRGLVDTANLQAGQKVLIHAAAGGVGHIAVQLAKARGAYVYGTASTRNQDFLHQLGADQPIDYTTTRFEEIAHDVDAVFDTIGGETQERSWHTLKPGGIMLSVIHAPSEELAAQFDCRGIMVMAMPPVAPVLREISALVEAGKIKPHVSEVMPLADTPKALEMLMGGHTRGKIVLQVAG